MGKNVYVIVFGKTSEEAFKNNKLFSNDLELQILN